MILLAKVGLGVIGTMAVAGAYTFREGVMRVDVDEYRDGGSHVHLWLPAAAVPMVMQFVPHRHFAKASHEMRECLPAIKAAAHELERLPDATYVEVRDGEQHVMVSTQRRALKIDVTDKQEDVHVRVPLETIEDVFAQIEASTPDDDSGA
jgi:hypothetical protein